MRNINNYIVEKLHLSKDTKYVKSNTDGKGISFEVAVFCKHVVNEMKYKAYMHITDDSVIIEFDNELFSDELDSIIDNIKKYIEDNKTVEYDIDCKTSTTINKMKKVSTIDIAIDDYLSVDD